MTGATSQYVPLSTWSGEHPLARASSRSNGLTGHLSHDHAPSASVGLDRCSPREHRYADGNDYLEATVLIHIDRATGHTAHCSDPNCPVTPHARTVDAARAHRLLLLGMHAHSAHRYAPAGEHLVAQLPEEFQPF